MSIEPQLIEFSGIGGLNLAKNKHTRSPVECDIRLNTQKLEDGVMSWRNGYKKVCNNAGNNGGFGLFTHTTVDPNTGATTVEKLMAGSKLYRVKDGTLTVTYINTTTNYTSLFFTLNVDENTRTWKAVIVADSVTILNQDLGVGVDEASIVTLVNLKTVIDALDDIACVIVGSDTVPAAYLIPVYNEPFEDTPFVLNFHYVEEVNHPTSAPAPFLGSFTNRNSLNFENISGVEISNLLVLTNGYDVPKCYDGVDCYKLGLPIPVVPSVAINLTGAVAAGDYIHQVQYVQVDAGGNEITSKESPSDATTLVGTDSFDVTVTNLLAASGYNTDCAIVAGAQSTVNTITVDNGSGGNHTMKVGQTAYFYDVVSAAYVQREITAIAANTITIVGAAVTVTDNSIISNNLRIRIQRTPIAGTIFQDVIDIPNNSFTATTVHNDNTLDTALGARYIVPPATQEHLLPPLARYASIAGTSQTGILLLADRIGNVYFSDITGPFYFPAQNRCPIPSATNAPVTGISPGKSSFFVFKLRETHRVSGDLVSGQYAVQQLSQVIGCAAHATIQDTPLGLIWLGDKGRFYLSAEDAFPIPVGDEVAPLFKKAGKTSIQILQSKRAVAIYDPETELYLCYVPTENTVGGNLYPTNDSITLTFDVPDKEWSLWKNMNMAGGAIVVDNDLFWVERRFSTFDSNMKYELHKRLNDQRVEDYVDHVNDIEWDIRLGWFNAGEAFRKKKFLKMGIVADSDYGTTDFECLARCSLDYISDVVRNEFTLDFSGSEEGGWADSSPWGEFAWGSPADTNRKAHDLGMEETSAIQPRFSFTGMYRQPIITAWAILVAAPYKIRLAIDA